MELPYKGRTTPRLLTSGYPSQHPARGERKQSLCHIFVKTCMLWLRPNCLLWKLVSSQLLPSLKHHLFLELDLHLSQEVQTDLCLRMSLGWSRTTDCFGYTTGEQCNFHCAWNICSWGHNVCCKEVSTLQKSLCTQKQLGCHSPISCTTLPGLLDESLGVLPLFVGFHDFLLV